VRAGSKSMPFRAYTMHTCEFRGFGLRLPFFFYKVSCDFFFYKVSCDFFFYKVSCDFLFYKVTSGIVKAERDGDAVPRVRAGSGSMAAVRVQGLGPRLDFGPEMALNSGQEDSSPQSERKDLPRTRSLSA